MGVTAWATLWFTSGTHAQLTHTTTDPTVTAALTHTRLPYTHHYTQCTNTLPLNKTLIQVLFKNKTPLKTSSVYFYKPYIKPLKKLYQLISWHNIRFRNCSIFI